MALTIRLTAGDEALIEQLKEQTGQASASRALLEAARIVTREHHQLQKEFAACREAYQELDREHYKLKDLIRVYHNINKEFAIISVNQERADRPDPG
jgi:hypothetical protein